MPNIIEFTVTVSKCDHAVQADTNSLDLFVEMLQSHAQECKAEDGTLTYFVTRGPHFFRAASPLVSLEGGQAIINGESHWSPPVALIRELSEQFVDLQFQVHGWDPMNGVEVWWVRCGEAVLLEEESYTPESNEWSDWKVLGKAVAPHMVKAVRKMRARQMIIEASS